MFEWVGEHISLGICVFLGRGTHHEGYVFPRLGNISVGICVSWVGENISLGMYVSWVREHISPQIHVCVSWVGKHISLGICVSWVGEHITRVCVSLVGDMCFLNRGTLFTRDMCLPGRGHLQESIFLKRSNLLTFLTYLLQL